MKSISVIVSQKNQFGYNDRLAILLLKNYNSFNEKKSTKYYVTCKSIYREVLYPDFVFKWLFDIFKTFRDIMENVSII